MVHIEPAKNAYFRYVQVVVLPFPDWEVMTKIMAVTVAYVFAENVPPTRAAVQIMPSWQLSSLKLTAHHLIIGWLQVGRRSFWVSAYFQNCSGRGFFMLPTEFGHSKKAFIFKPWEVHSGHRINTPWSWTMIPANTLQAGFGIRSWHTNKKT